MVKYSAAKALIGGGNGGAEMVQKGKHGRRMQMPPQRIQNDILHVRNVLLIKLPPAQLGQCGDRKLLGAGDLAGQMETGHGSELEGRPIAVALIQKTIQKRKRNRHNFPARGIIIHYSVAPLAHFLAAHLIHVRAVVLAF
mmetsp:Transcript_18735/g.24819  ORF Transcript_18735/g.24819 Transcript_18735/m.24819 type:complete len:140 (-) Transcript_18735:46-465(-)